MLSRSHKPGGQRHSAVGRLVRSVGALGFAQILNVASNLMLVPLSLSFWHAEIYGEWVALSALVAYLAATDFGMNSAASNALLSAYAKKETDRYRTFQASALAFYLAAALIVTLAAGVICILCPVAAWLGVFRIDKVTAACVIWLLAGRLMWTMPAGQIWNIFRSTGNLALTQWFVNANALLLTVVTALVLVLHGGVLALAAWSWLPLLVCALVAWMVVGKQHSKLLPDLTEANISDAKSLLRPSAWFGVMMLATAIGLNGPTIMAARVFGGVAVAVLVTTRTLANLVHQFLSILCAAIWPELTHLESVGAYAALRTAHRLITAACIFAAIAIAGTLWFHGDQVLRVWTGGRLTAHPWLLRGFLLYIVGRAPWFASSMLGMATNRNKRLAWHCLAAAALGVGAAACLMPWLHLVAVPCGLLLGEAVLCYHFVVHQACRMIQEKYGQLVLRTWSTLILACIASLLAGWGVKAVGIRPVEVEWGASVLATTTATGLCVWFSFLQLGEREFVAERFLRGIGRKREPISVSAEAVR